MNKLLEKIQILNEWKFHRPFIIWRFGSLYIPRLNLVSPYGKIQSSPGLWCAKRTRIVWSQIFLEPQFCCSAPSSDAHSYFLFFCSYSVLIEQIASKFIYLLQYGEFLDEICFWTFLLHCKKSDVHPFGKQVVNIWKRSIIHAFSDIFRKENPTFSRCFRVGKLEYSFHYPAVFLHSELYENDCFLSVKSTVNRRENSLYSVVYWCFPSNKTLFSQTFSVEDNAFSSIF